MSFANDRIDLPVADTRFLVHKLGALRDVYAIRNVTPACMPTTLPVRLLDPPVKSRPQVATGLATRPNAAMDYLSPDWAALQPKPTADLLRGLRAPLLPQPFLYLSLKLSRHSVRNR